MLIINKILKYAKSIILGFLILIFTTLIYQSIKIKLDKNYIPSILGYTYLNVLSNSMDPEFKVHDLIISKKTNDKTDIKEGDIITFINSKRLISHRVVSVEENNQIFRTKGDANKTIDVSNVERKDIVSIHKVTVPKLGYVVAKFQDFKFLMLLWLIITIEIVLNLVKEIKKVKKLNKTTQVS